MTISLILESYSWAIHTLSNRTLLVTSLRYFSFATLSDVGFSKPSIAGRSRRSEQAGAVANHTRRPAIHNSQRGRFPYSALRKCCAWTTCNDAIQQAWTRRMDSLPSPRSRTARSASTSSNSSSSTRTRSTTMASRTSTAPRGRPTMARRRLTASRVARGTSRSRGRCHCHPIYRCSHRPAYTDLPAYMY